MKVCIVYGWTEGKWHGKQLRIALAKAGYSNIKSPAEADIIIAHSGGCYMLPAQTSARLVILIGLPLWSGKTITKGLKEKVNVETKNTRFFIKTAHNLYYLVTQPIHWSKMRRAIKSKTLPNYTKVKIIVLRNEHDPFMHTDESQELAQKRGWEYQTLPGHHDDLWVNPEPYLEVISRNTGA